MQEFKMSAFWMRSRRVVNKFHCTLEHANHSISFLWKSIPSTMDFRSQLSALNNKNNTNNNSGRGGGGSGGGGGRSPARGYSNTNNNYHSRGSGGERDSGRGAERDRGERDSGRGGGGGGGSGNYYGNQSHTNRNYNNNNNNNNDRNDRNDRRRPGGYDHYDRRHGGPPTSRRRHTSPDRDGLSDLRDLGYRIPNRRQQLQQEALEAEKVSGGGGGGDTTAKATTTTTNSSSGSSKKKEKKKKTKHIALLAITIDDLPYEHIWKAWCQMADDDDNDDDDNDLWISLVCHAKYPKRVQSEWLRQRLLVHPPKLGRGNSFADPEFLTHTPKWGSVEITRAMVDLLEDGMRIGNCQRKDLRFAAKRYLIKQPVEKRNNNNNNNDPIIPPVDQFLYISETCLPVKTVREVFNEVADPSISWVNGRHRKGSPNTPKNKYESDQFGGINRRLPGQYRWKADQWILLCRNHADLILGMDRPHKPEKHQLWNSFRDINASDEMYFPTCLAILGLLRYTLPPASTTTTTATNTIPATNTTTTTEGTTTSGNDAPAVTAHSPNKGPAPSSHNSEGGKGPPTSTTTTPTPHVPLPEVVIKRPVTYTDWSEGMRNPATYTKGLVDFERVAKEARAKGCLLARKFALFVAVPGIKPEEQVITGQITVDEWKTAVERMHEMDEKNKPPPKVPEREEDEEDEDNKNDDEEEEGEEDDEGRDSKVKVSKTVQQQDDSSSGEEEEEGEEGENSEGEANNDDEDDDDDDENNDDDDDDEDEDEGSDQGETQLE